MLETNSRKNLIPMIQQIASSSCATLMHLDLTRFSEETQDGLNIISALLDAKITSLQKAILSCLYKWWVSDECFNMLIALIGL